MIGGAFAPTHLVPAGGLAAYERPDPAAAPVAQLDPNLEVSVAERLGDWARIVCSNGWAAWVDGRRLLARGAAAAAPAGATVAKPAVNVAVTPALMGAVVAAVGMLPSWIRGGLGSTNAFDIPVSVLWSSPSSTRPGSIDLWIPLAALVAVGVAGCVRDDLRLRRVGGFGAVAVAALFLVWLVRLANEPIDAGLFDLLGAGAPIVAGGGALLALGKATR